VSRFVALLALVLVLAPRAASAQDKDALTQDQCIDLADRILDEDDEAGAAKALAQLKAMGDDGVWYMLEASKDLAIEDQQVLGQAIAALGKAAVKELVSTLGDEDEDVHQTVLFALEELGTDALPALAKVLRDGPDDQRAEVAVLLGKLEEDAVPELIAILKDGSPEARALAAVTLVDISGDAAIQPLAAILPSSNKPAREAAFSALLSIGSEDVASATSVALATQALLKSNVADTRECAVVLLGKFGGASVMKTVLDALCSPDDKIRASASECAAFIGEPAVPDLIHCLNASDGKVVEAAADALAMMGEPAVPQLTKMLRAPVVQVKGNSACALGRMRRRASVPDIAPLLEDDDKNVRFVAKSALLAITGEALETKAAALAWWEKHKDDPPPAKASEPNAPKKDAPR